MVGESPIQYSPGRKGTKIFAGLSRLLKDAPSEASSAPPLRGAGGIRWDVSLCYSAVAGRHQVWLIQIRWARVRPPSDCCDDYDC
ncbi:hypothetical protein M404DRAFT_1002449 [Pisolithus tinctorius Marx 270]|uniref:Uncharacterized protein n=1 Tax=Pisolithus tinctorius Marx 270 TaxID=870435 RepID=A0A0C3NNI0_PISTI|nr:hypothetical protein M404DRAFT_1002449 [Pisolithus tinctorius Marx 270]